MMMNVNGLGVNSNCTLGELYLASGAFTTSSILSIISIISNTFTSEYCLFSSLSENKRHVFTKGGPTHIFAALLTRSKSYRGVLRRAESVYSTKTSNPTKTIPIKDLTSFFSSVLMLSVQRNKVQRVISGMQA